MNHARGIASLILVAVMAGALFVPADCDGLPDIIPVPRPDHEGAWVLILEETAERSPSVAAFLDDTAYLAELYERGLHWRPYDDDSPGAAPYVGLTQERPALVIVSATGEVLHVGPWPDTHEALDETIREVTGR